MHYILIVVFIGYFNKFGSLISTPVPVQVAEFNTGAACETAKTEIAKHLNPQSFASCFAKGESK